MKTIVLIVILFWLAQPDARAQSNGTYDTAYRHAQKVKQSLSLDSSMVERLFHINVQVAMQKLGSNTNNAQVQKAERFRDTAYRRVMTDSLFHLYLQRKQTLLSGN